jgi:alkanesulfonate monooxygenase SsuD/methylene tetrahydromethanopterin reductase-like flavin-dependent oxidoreductase (luciferase family)
LVASPHFRHPVSFVREIIAVDDVSDGRFLLGVGAGAIAGFDTEVLGAPPMSAKAQVDRFAEFLELLHATLTQERTTWHGEYYHAVDARSAPGSVRRPRVPFLVAANGPRSMGLAARYGQGWVTTGRKSDHIDDWWRAVAELSKRMDDALARAGRDPRQVDRYLSLDASPRYSLSSVSCFSDMVGHAAELGFTDVIAHWPREDGVYAGREVVLEAVAENVLPELAQARQ